MGKSIWKDKKKNGNKGIGSEGLNGVWTIGLEEKIRLEEWVWKYGIGFGIMGLIW